MHKLNKNSFILETAEGLIALYVDTSREGGTALPAGEDLDQLVLQIENAYEKLAAQAREWPIYLLEEQIEHFMKEGAFEDDIHFARVKSNGQVDLERLKDRECNPVLSMHLDPLNLLMHCSDPFGHVHPTHFDIEGSPDHWIAYCTEGYSLLAEHQAVIGQQNRGNTNEH